MTEEKNFLENLNERQKEAVLYSGGPLLVLAGAGSGKTKTMVSRIARLLDDGEPAESILAVTFTNKAAREMKERVQNLSGGDAESQMWIKTFHAACLAMLRDHAYLLGYTNKFTVYDTDDQKSLVRRIFRDTKKDKGIDLKDMFSVEEVLDGISTCKEEGIKPEQFFVLTLPGNAASLAADVAYEYNERLKKSNAMDFDDLLVNAVSVLESHPDVRDLYKSRFRHILVDEYQDINELQYRFVKLLSDTENPDVCVVGDDDQCIYEWRGANPNLIIEFENGFPGAKVVKLEQNYRSTKNIINGAASVIANNTNRKKKTLWTQAPEGAHIDIVYMYDYMEEPDMIARIIEAFAFKGRPYSDFAVLYRTNRQSRLLEEKFLKCGIPFNLIRGTSFYKRKEIKDITAYMRLAENPDDDEAFLRIVNIPQRGIGSKSIEVLRSAASARSINLLEAASSAGKLSEIGSKAAMHAQDFAMIIKTLSKLAQSEDLSKFYEDVLLRSGYRQMLKSSKADDAQDRLSNLEEMASIIAEYEGNTESSSLQGFLEQIALMSDADTDTDNPNAVSLMTLHSAKGLEFNAVFIVGNEEGLFPLIRDDDGLDKIEEERRLCYVGMTRARKKLWMTCVANRMLNGKFYRMIPSRFLDEIDKKTVRKVVRD